MDIVLALLPWKLVWPLNMRRKEKIGVIVAMSMGVFAGITAIIKVVQTPKLKGGDPCKFPQSQTGRESCESVLTGASRNSNS